jgi:hypothetical protein
VSQGDPPGELADSLTVAFWGKLPSFTRSDLLRICQVHSNYGPAMRGSVLTLQGTSVDSHWILMVINDVLLLILLAANQQPGSTAHQTFLYIMLWCSMWKPAMRITARHDLKKYFENAIQASPVLAPFDPTRLRNRLIHALRLSDYFPAPHTCPSVRAGSLTESNPFPLASLELNGKDPWGVDGAEALGVIAAARRRGERADLWTERVYVERALAVVSLAVVATRESGELTVGALQGHGDTAANAYHPVFDKATAAQEEGTESRRERDSNDELAQRLGNSDIEGLRVLVATVEKFLDALEEMEGEMGPLRFHRGVVFFNAARATEVLTGAGLEADRKVWLEKAREQFMEAERWTMHIAFEQRGLCALHSYQRIRIDWLHNFDASSVLWLYDCMRF